MRTLGRRARSKSMSRACHNEVPVACTTTLSGLRSQCKTPRSCMRSMPSAMWYSAAATFAKVRRTCGVGPCLKSSFKGSTPARRAFRDVPPCPISTSKWPWTRRASTTGTTGGGLSSAGVAARACATQASLSALRDSGSSVNSTALRLRLATSGAQPRQTEPLDRGLITLTVPKPPAPRLSPTSKRPAHGGLPSLFVSAVG
mmetsp:Transcript_84889/g.259179  ORF Transcript_84889/g.259179 Transcript_84889/m.259179 type:complete len:201 (+) Transcript_84889:427-1029(+)